MRWGKRIIAYSEESLGDLLRIRTQDGLEQMLMLFGWCERLSEPATRLDAERLGGPGGLFRLRVGDYHIVYQLLESPGEDAIRVVRVRQRKPLS